jgi:arylsulfatase A-like enzyme
MMALQRMMMAPLLGLLVLCTTLAHGGAQLQPHVLMIVADDFGYNDVGYHQSTPTAPKPHPANPRGEATTDDAAGVMPTPTLDQLASEGTKLEM